MKASKFNHVESQTIGKLLFMKKPLDKKETIWCGISMFRNEYNIVQYKKVGKDFRS